MTNSESACATRRCIPKFRITHIRQNTTWALRRKARQWPLRVQCEAYIPTAWWVKYLLPAQCRRHSCKSRRFQRYSYRGASYRKSIGMPHRSYMLYGKRHVYLNLKSSLKSLGAWPTFGSLYPRSHPYRGIRYTVPAYIRRYCYDSIERREIVPIICKTIKKVISKLENTACVVRVRQHIQQVVYSACCSVYMHCNTRYTHDLLYMLSDNARIVLKLRYHLLYCLANNIQLSLLRSHHEPIDVTMRNSLSLSLFSSSHTKIYTIARLMYSIRYQFSLTLCKIAINQ